MEGNRVLYSPDRFYCDEDAPMMIKARKLFLYFTIPFLFIMTTWFVGCDKKSEEESTNDAPVKLTDSDYAGTQTCASCHTQEYGLWKNSDHDLAMMEADTASVKGDFNTTFNSQGVTSRFFKKGNKFFVNTQGPDSAYHDYEVAFTFGITPLQQYLVKFPGGRLQCLRTAWDTQKNRWFDLYPDMKIQPDEWLHWSRGGLNWNTMCADCHSTNLHKNFNEQTNSFNTTFSIMDVSCEACHGPGKKHVELVSDPDFDSAEYNPAASHLYQTTRQMPHDQVDQCARCHARRVQYTEAYNHEGKFMDHYVPELLRDDIYYADGQIMDEDYEYGSFLQSKMYKNNVKCANCHNPHSLKLKAVGNALCGQCHIPAKYDTPKHHFHEVETAGAQCINCHMPGRYYMGNDFRRDHSLRVPRPDLSVKYNVPNACNQCHTNKTAAWAAANVVKWYGPTRAPHFSDVLTLASTRTAESVEPLTRLAGDESQPAIARSTAIWYLDQIVPQESINAIAQLLKSNEELVRHAAVTALEDLPAEQKVQYITPLLTDNVRTVRLAAANALADVPQEKIIRSYQEAFERSMQEYQQALVWRADFPGGQFEKGVLLERTGKDELAKQAYIKALEMDDHLNMARWNLAYLYNRQGKNDEAIRLFKIIVEQEPNYGMAWYSLALLCAEVKDLDHAIEYLTKAAELERSPRVYYNLAIAYQQTNQPVKAEKAYLKGLSLNPQDYDLMNALSILYIQQKQFAKAKPYLEKLSTAFPGNNEIQQMMKMVSAQER